MTGGAATNDSDVSVPKLVDIRDGVAIVDERQTRKQPDWTYAAP
jgi:hypothetical protein